MHSLFLAVASKYHSFIYLPNYISSQQNILFIIVNFIQFTP